MSTRSPTLNEFTPLLEDTGGILPGLTSPERSSTSSATTEVNFPQQAGAIRPDDPCFALFGSLLLDSIPGESLVPSDELNNFSTPRSVILSYILQNSIQTTSIIVAGRLGPDELSVAAFSLMLAFVTGEYQLALSTQV